MKQPDVVGVVLKWHGQTDGPWVHIDSVLEYIEDGKSRLLAAAVAAGSSEQEVLVSPLVTLLDALIANYAHLKSQATRTRLETLAAHVNVESLTNDLLELRDELGHE